MRAALVLAGLVAAGVATLGGSGAGAAPGPGCTPGSGPNYAGKHVDAAMLQGATSLRCANFRGDDLSGLDLTQANLQGIDATGANLRNARLDQADLTGAKLVDADLRGASLIQATLTDADLTGAKLNGDKLGQAEAGGVTLKNADLSDADLSQAHLSGANLDGAEVSGADFTQADLDGTHFDGARGLTPWSLYVLIVAGVVFVLVGGLATRRALRRREQSGPSVPSVPSGPEAAQAAFAQPASTGPAFQSYWTKQGQPAAAGGLGGVSTAMRPFKPINGPATRSVGRGVGMGLLAAAIIAFGTHLFLGSLIGLFSFAYDTLATATCSGPQCAVGVDSGVAGQLGGIAALIGGFMVLARA